MEKLAELIKNDLRTEFDKIKSELDKIVIDSIKSCGSCTIDLWMNTLELKGDNHSAAKIPTKFVSVAEEYYKYQGMSTYRRYTPGGSISKLEISL